MNWFASLIFALTALASLPVPGLEGAEQNRRPLVIQDSWATNLLVQFKDALVGDEVQFPLDANRIVTARVSYVEATNQQLFYIAGSCTSPWPGRFFFQKQNVRGIAGDFVGIVEFPSNELAYRLEPSTSGRASIANAHPLGSIECRDLPLPRLNELPRPGKVRFNNPDFPPVNIPSYQNGVIPLESQPGMIPVIYLDFQGGYTPTWGGITYARPSFSNEQIYDVWLRVSEDFAPFNINVTTDLRAFQLARETNRQRVIITPTDDARPGYGGAAYFGSFNWSGDTPCWSFVTSDSKSCAQACSHEAGHTLGLAHDGQEINGTHFEYYYGHGDGETSWAPVMGAAYDKNVTQWSKGDYQFANNPQNQLAIIVSQNQVQFRSDDTGDTLATSRYLELYDDFGAGAQGIIETVGDTDAFQFTTSGGEVRLRADPAPVGPNLAVQVSIFDANDNLVASENPQNTLWAAIITNLPAGTYTFRVTGSGRNNPLSDGFSSYASLGRYSVTGSVANARLPNRFSIGENSPVGMLVGVVPANSQDSSPRSYRITSGNASNTFSIDDTGNLSIANNSLLDYEALVRSRHSVQFELLIDIIDNANATLSEKGRRAVVTVTNINEAPTLNNFVSGDSQWVSPRNVNMGCFLSNGCQFAVSVLEHAPRGIVIGRVVGVDSDLDNLLAYTISSGDPEGMFAIDGTSGVITVLGDLVAAWQFTYALDLMVSDQQQPSPLTAAATVILTVELPYSRGSLACAVYTNIPGSEVAFLTNALAFPQDPAWEEPVGMSESSLNEQGGFGAVLRGYLLPPFTGDYTFWIASREDGELWLGSSTNPASMTRIAYVNAPGDWPAVHEWTKYPSQQSTPISLAAGRAYYLELRQKGENSTDYISVAWECSSNLIAQEVIPGQYLSPVSLNYVPHPLPATLFLHENAFAGACFGTLAVSDLNPGDMHFSQIISGNEAGLFALEPTNGNFRLVSDVGLKAATNTHCTLQVKSTDNGVPPLSGSAQIEVVLVASNLIAASSIQQEIWTNIGFGTNLAALTNYPGFPKRPDALRPLANLESFDGPSTVAVGVMTNAVVLGGFDFTPPGSVPVTFPRVSFDGFNFTLTASWGSRIRAYLVPTNTGFYNFFLVAADEAQLMLSPGTNATEASTIAAVAATTLPLLPVSWTEQSGQQSAPVLLRAGERYYLEVLHMRRAAMGGLLFGGAFFQVGWAGPGLPGTNVIDASFLRPVDIEYSPELNPKTIQMPISVANGSVVTNLSGLDSILEPLAYKLVSGNTSNTFGLDPATGRLTIADNSALAARSIWSFNLVVEVQDSGYGGLYPLRTTRATFPVQIIDTQPAVVWSGGGKDANWSSLANWSGTLPTENSKLTFFGTASQTNHNDLLTRVGAISLFNGGFVMDGNPLVLLEGLSSRGENQWNIESSLPSLQSFVISSGTLTLRGPISGQGGVNKSGGGALLLAGANSYIGPTLIGEGTLRVAEATSCSSSPLIDVGAGATLDVLSVTNAYHVPSGQTLRGSGRVLGNVVSYGTFVAGLATGGATSRFSFQNDLTLSGYTVIPITKITPPYHRPFQYTNGIRVGGTVGFGGLLTVTNDGSAIGLGDTFTLFEAQKLTGSFAEVDLPPLIPGLSWDASRLVVDGTIKVGAGTVQIIPEVLSNDSLALRVQTVDGLHYVLESTSSLQPPITWKSSTRTGTGEIMTLLVPLTKDQPQRFFRVRVY